MLASRFLPFQLAAVAAIAGLATAAWTGWQLAVILAANGFFVVYLALELGRIGRLDKSFLRKHAAAGDLPALMIFCVALATVVAAIGSLFIAVNSSTTGSLLLALALASVPLGWATIHIMAAIHYAHLFWQPELGQDQPRKGLEFPGTKAPDGWDFVYFAFVIGMTAQTSDVQISGQHIRRFNLIHAIASFFFNTVLVAAAVNVAVALGK